MHCIYPSACATLLDLHKKCDSSGSPVGTPKPLPSNLFLLLTEILTIGVLMDSSKLWPPRTWVPPTALLHHYVTIYGNLASHLNFSEQHYHKPLVMYDGGLLNSASQQM